MLLAKSLLLSAGAAPIPFAATAYTGNGSTQSIVNDLDLSTDGGLVWIKNRDQADSHVWVDTERGATKVLSSDGTAVESTDADTVTGFNTDGFDLGADLKVNTSTENYVAWSFLKKAVFFDIVTYAGNSTAGRNISHALESVPGMMVVKNLGPTVSSWTVYHRSINVDADAAPETDYAFLESTAAAGDSTHWNDTAPTDAVFTVGSSYRVNATGENYAAYLFAHDPTSNIQCGGYTGNGSATGPTVSLGKRPKFVMIKRWDSVGDWSIFDDTRDATNPNTAYLAANSSGAEGAGRDIDLNDTGFQIKTTDANVNANTGEYLYVAVTE